MTSTETTGTMGLRRPEYPLWALLCLGLLVRLPFLPFDFQAITDLAQFQSWAVTLHEQALTRIYDREDVNYPPVLLYYLAAIDAPTRLVGLPQDPALLNSLIKLPVMLADVATAWLITWPLRKAQPRRRLLYCGLYLFSPAVWYESAHWGQVDSLYTLGLVAAILLLERGRDGWAWLVWGLTLGTKLLAVSALPLLAAATWLRHGTTRLARDMAGAAAVLVLLAAPWLLAGQGESLLRAVVRPYEPRLTAYAYNLWYLLILGRVKEFSSLDSPAGWPVTYRLLSLGIFGAFVLFVLYAVWLKRPRALALTTALLVFGMFTLLSDMHGRYLYPALAFLLLAAAQAEAAALGRPGNGAAASSRLLRWAYAGLTGSFFVNLVLVAPFTPALRMGETGVANPLPYWVLPLATLIVAAFHVFLLAALSVWAARRLET